MFTNMEDLTDIDKCSTISELIESNIEDKKEENVEEKFDSLYEKVNHDGENFEAIVLINNSTRTAVITPIVRKKCLVDYESSDTEWEDSPKKLAATPHPKINPKKTTQHTATPHIKKLLVRQKHAIYDEMVDEENYNDSPKNGKTPLRSSPEKADQQMTTPTSQLPHVLKLAEVVTTSTPTHPGTWSMFSGAGTDSPLSEIEQTGSPAESIDKEVEPSRTEESNQPKLKGIISRVKFGTQDSSEKQVTFQDSENVTEPSVKSKKVKFAEDTVFKAEPKIKRVFTKPRRMLTPGRQRPKFSHNPRFQALINRFESQRMPLTQTPVTKKDEEKSLESTPPAGDHNIPARAISFKDDSPIVETESQSKEANELFKSCVGSPAPLNNAITSLTSNIAGTLQTCLTSVLRSTDEETEIQFKFVISKKKVSVKRIAEDGNLEKYTEMDREEQYNKENIWSTVAKAVKNVFWGSQGTHHSNQATPYTSLTSNDTTSSSASKRKFDDMSDSDLSPLNHKRHKYEGRIKGRPPLHRARTCSVSCLRSSHSAEQHSMLKELSMYQEDHMNSSF
ncbi:jg18395 [Pararge aegeria aegeria]|uniref:Jg18395 protein n=1 Tax=Pararge aegeria aegeria TaxID=348720 RepID=A0A8S4R8T1_9NEOP|nr:jg18395 [Pararge aegeria aegeria]